MINATKLEQLETDLKQLETYLCEQGAPRSMQARATNAALAVRWASKKFLGKK
jgi:hypothetical protein